MEFFPASLERKPNAGIFPYFGHRVRHSFAAISRDRAGLYFSRRMEAASRGKRRNIDESFL